MSTVFLIGNGFDLSCGMKTRYTDVYNSYCKILDSDSDLIQNFKNDISSNYENWSDFEKGMADYAERFQNEDEFLFCVRDFRKYLNKYLDNQQKLFFESIKNKMELVEQITNEMRNSIDSFYKDITHSITDAVYPLLKDLPVIISFNYTYIFDALLKHLYSVMTSNSFNHLHGIINEDIVMGMDNESQIKTSYKLTNKGKRAFVKTFFNNQFDTNRVKIAKSWIENASVICTYGLSLGESDLTWREALIDFLKNNINGHLFLYDYELSNYEGLLVDEKLDLEEEKKIKILNEWRIDDYERIYDRFHIPCGKKIFKIRELIDNYTIKEQKK